MWPVLAEGLLCSLLPLELQILLPPLGITGKFHCAWVNLLQTCENIAQPIALWAVSTMPRSREPCKGSWECDRHNIGQRYFRKGNGLNWRTEEQESILTGLAGAVGASNKIEEAS